jgi:outer membrane protein TolC
MGIDFFGNRFFKLSLVWTILIGGFSHAEDLVKYTLRQCQVLALKKNHTIAEMDEQVRQSAERLIRAKAAYYPTLALGSNLTLQEATSSAVGQDFFKQNESTIKTTLKQNIFRGFLDVSTVKQKKLQQTSLEYLRKQTELALLSETAQNFFEILSQDQEILTYTQEIATHQKRREEIVDLKKMGRAREIDVVSIDQSIAMVEASQAGTSGRLNSSREMLLYLTGLANNEELLDTLSIPEPISPVDHWLQGIDRKPEMLLARQELALANEGLYIAKAGYFPSADLVGDYYLERPGIASDISWDVMLVLSFNIFEGGVNRSLMREAVSYQKEKETHVKSIQEQATRDIRSLYQIVIADFAAAERLQTARTLAQKKHDLLAKENRMGLSTNMEVLESLALVYQLERALKRAQYLAKNDYTQLQILAFSGSIDEYLFK